MQKVKGKIGQAALFLKSQGWYKYKYNLFNLLKLQTFTMRSIVMSVYKIMQ